MKSVSRRFMSRQFEPSGLLRLALESPLVLLLGLAVVRADSMAAADLRTGIVVALALGFALLAPRWRPSLAAVRVPLAALAVLYLVQAAGIWQWPWPGTLPGTAERTFAPGVILLLLVIVCGGLSGAPRMGWAALAVALAVVLVLALPGIAVLAPAGLTDAGSDVALMRRVVVYGAVLMSMLARAARAPALAGRTCALVWVLFTAGLVHAAA